jgi:hypothetical protein
MKQRKNNDTWEGTKKGTVFTNECRKMHRNERRNTDTCEE